MALGVEEFIDEGLDQFWNLLNELESIDDVTQRRPRLGQFAAQLSALADDISGMGDADREILRQLRSGIADMQIQVLNSLHRTTHPVVLPYVRTLALGASDENARIAAIDALADARGTDAAEVFAAIACKPGSLPVRAEATLALQALGTGAGASALKRTEDTLASDPVLSPLLRRHGSEIVIP